MAERLRGSPDEHGGSPGAAAGFAAPGDRPTLVDIVVIAGVPVILGGLFLLPDQLKRQLVLAYAQPTIEAAFGSHFIHLDDAHLAANVATYLLVVPVTYLLASLSNQRRRFFMTFFTILVCFPFALSALNIALARPRVGLGFSGLAMAFFGFLPVVFVGYLHDRIDPRIDIEAAPALFFIGCAIIAALAVPDPRLAALIATGACVAGVATLIRGPGVSVYRVLEGIRSVADRSGHLELLITTVLVLILVPVAAFPRDPVTDGGVLNVYLHVLGYCLGFLAPYLTFLMLDGKLLTGSSAVEVTTASDGTPPGGVSSDR